MRVIRLPIHLDGYGHARLPRSVPVPRCHTACTTVLPTVAVAVRSFYWSTRLTFYPRWISCPRFLYVHTLIYAATERSGRSPVVVCSVGYVGASTLPSRLGSFTYPLRDLPLPRPAIPVPVVVRYLNSGWLRYHIVLHRSALIWIPRFYTAPHHPLRLRYTPHYALHVTVTCTPHAANTLRFGCSSRRSLPFYLPTFLPSRTTHDHTYGMGLHRCPVRFTTVDYCTLPSRYILLRSLHTRRCIYARFACLRATSTLRLYSTP